MPANIKKNNVRALDIHLINDEYWDFMLYKGEVYGNYEPDCLSASIDMTNIAEDGKLYSTTTWANAINSGVTMTNIGMTGVDNGFISYDKDTVLPNDFWNLYTGSTYELNDTRFFLSPITGNTKQYSYPTEIVEESGDTYMKLTGGFYQGFFKLEGYDYQTLPTTIDDEWNFEFVLRKQDYLTAENAVNNTHPENKGIFFYIGTRAENKFSEIYNGVYDNEESFKTKNNPNNTSYGGNYMDIICTPRCEDQIDLSEVEISEENTKSYTEIETDNKYLFFNHTCTGFTTHNWNEENKVIFDIENREYIDNPFNLYNHTCTGYTVRDYEKITIPSGSGYDSEGKYDVMKDVIGNSFALQINDNGSISYKYIAKDCDAESGYTVLTESTLSGLVKNGEWNVINVTFKSMNGYVNDCGESVPKDRKMKMYIYLNGYLVFISKELPMFNFKALNESSERQEGVPYNISLGGGSQGLMERIWPNYYDISDIQYEIEKNYAGSFIGDMKSFKFYTCKLNISQIRANAKIWDK